MKFQTLLLPLVLALAALSSHAATVSVPATWKVQPATDSKTPPDDKNWGEFKSDKDGDWRGGSVTKTGESWKGVDRKTVNNLWMEQSFDLSAEAKGQRVFADFRRIEGDAIVFVNGTRIGELRRPGGEIELTQAAKFGGVNQLRVFITREYKDISRGFEQDYLRYITRQEGSEPIPMSNWGLGITAPVQVLLRPASVGLRDVFVQPSWRQKQLKLSVETDAATTTDGVVIVGDVYDAKNQKVLTVRSEPFSAPVGIATRDVAASWPNPTLWELDGGALYAVRVRLERGGATLHQLEPVTFGFREIWTDGRLLMMNGHPIQLRMASLLQGGGDNTTTIDFFRSIGYNAVIFQDHAKNWWNVWSETPFWNEEVLRHLDETGVMVSLPAPSISRGKRALFDDPAALEDYQREMALYQRRYRNHPAIFAWTVGMNTYNPRSAIAPQGMGKREKTPAAPAQAINAAVEIAKIADATRPVYSHADGGTGDIASSNTYLNFVPLQEREEWPSDWAATGDMPAQMAEFGQPYTANFWQGRRFLMTEYLAMTFGDEAYKRESPKGLQDALEVGLRNKNAHGPYKDDYFKEFPLYWEFQRLWVRNTNRSWRTWGVNAGWSYWTWGPGYGNPPSYPEGASVSRRYRDLDAAQLKDLSWVSPNYEIHQQANKPLLAYLAGAPATDKTHSYYVGQTVKKQLALDWDGPGNAEVSLTWKVVGAQPNKVWAQGATKATLAPGDTKLLPIQFDAPAVAARTPLRIEMEARAAKGAVIADSFDIQAFPASKPLTLNSKIALYDPKGLSSKWISAAGVRATAWKVGEPLAGFDTLIIGREALTDARELPYAPADVARGLRVLILEQKPEIWTGMGFEINTRMTRRAFARDLGNPILSGVSSEDLAYWSGDATLLPPGVTQPSAELHAPKWTNRHGLMSVSLQIPETVGFTPVIACEFDLNYSPLLQMSYGQGAVTFCTLDFSQRAGTDPAATLLAHNLLQSVATPPAPRRTMAVVGKLDPALASLQIEADSAELPAPVNGLVVVASPTDAATQRKVDAFAESGGVVVNLMSGAPALKAAGFATQTAKLYRVSADAQPITRAIGPGLLRWRDELSVEKFAPTGQLAGSQVLADGVVLVRAQGQGEQIYLQVGPQMLATRYADDADKTAAIQTSVQRLRQLTAQLLTNAGAGASPAIAKRLSLLKSGPAFQTLTGWQVLGPFPMEKEDGEAMLNTAFPGEADAIAGDTNPNTTYKRADGQQLDWRGTVSADGNGYIDLAAQLKSPIPAVVYLTKEIPSEKARTATLNIGGDYRFQVWINGKAVFRTLKGLNRAGAYQVLLPLKAGTNVLTIKAGSGSRGFGLYTSLAEALTAEQKEQAATPAVGLYEPLAPNFDPYTFHYW